MWEGIFKTKMAPHPGRDTRPKVIIDMAKLTTTTPKSNAPAEMANFFDKSKLQSQIIRENEAEGFLDRFHSFYMVIAWGILPLLIVWSIITEFLFLYRHFTQSTGSLPLTLVFTFLVILLVEGLKAKTAVPTLRMFTHGWFWQGWHYKAVLVFLLPVMAISYIGSAYMSVKGGPEIVYFFNSNNEELQPTLISLDSIHAGFDARTAPLLTNLAKAQKSTWGGKPTAEGLALSQKIQDQINRIEAERTTTLTEARALNQQLMGQWRERVTHRGGWMAGFAGIGEILQLICYLLLQIFHRSAYKEVAHVDPETNVQQPSPSSFSSIPNTDPSGQQSSVQQDPAVAPGAMGAICSNSAPIESESEDIISTKPYHPIGFRQSQQVDRQSNKKNKRAPKKTKNRSPKSYLRQQVVAKWKGMHDPKARPETIANRTLKFSEFSKELEEKFKIRTITGPGRAIQFVQSLPQG